MMLMADHQACNMVLIVIGPGTIAADEVKERPTCTVDAFTDTQ